MSNIVMPRNNHFKISDGFRPAGNGSLYIGKAGTDPTIAGNQLVIQGRKVDGTIATLTQPITLNSLGQPVDSSGASIDVLVDTHYSLVVIDGYNKVQTSSETNLVSEIDNFVALRTLPVLYEGQVVTLLGWAKGTRVGGGTFVGHKGTATDNRGTIAAGNGFYWQRIVDKDVTPEMFGATGNGTIDDRVGIQKAIDYCNANYVSGVGPRIVTFTSTYVVSLDPSAPNVVGENSVGRTAINLLSGVTLQGNGKIILYSGTGGTTSGGVITNYSGPCNNVIIRGITIDGAAGVISGTGISCIKLLDGDNILVDGVTVLNSTAGGIYLRQGTNATYGCSNSRVVNCFIKGVAYIGIQLQRPDTITVMNNVILNCTDNAIDVEGNDSSITGQGIARKVLITGNNVDTCLAGVFLESCGDINVTSNIITNFKTHGIIQNRINSGSFNVSITSNVINGLSTSSVSGITWNNNVGHCRVASNKISNVNYAFRSIKGTNIDIGVNELKAIAIGILYVSNVASGFVYSRIAEQWYNGSQTNGVPYTYSGRDYPGNNSTRYYRVKIDETYFSQSAGVGEPNFVYRTGTLPTNSGWGANGGFSLYGSVVTGETVVALASNVSTPGNYILIGTKYYLMYSNAASYTVVRQWNAATSTFEAGDFTADLNSALAYSMYRSTWAEQ